MKVDMATLAKNIVQGNPLPSIHVMTVTPDKAREWLSRNIGNRPAYPSHVAKLEQQIKDGRWRMTGDPIRFSTSGKLIDGQHRLQAILNSGISVQCVVMHDLNDDIFDVLDSGKVRSKTDVLFIELGLPVETCKILSSAAGLALDYELEQYGFHCRSDKAAILSFVDARPDFVRSAEIAQALPHITPVPRAIGAFFYYYASKRDVVAADRFLERFMVGAVDGVNDNLLHLRNLCTNARALRRPISRHEVICRLIRIWNAEQRGAPIKYFSNTGVRKGEAFPRFI